MKRRLKTVLMATVLATSFLPTRAVCADSAPRAQGITTTTDNSGRRIYVNEDAPRGDASVPAASAPSIPRSRAVYWSSSERRYKPVSTSGAVMRAARSAASEVNSYLDSQAAGRDSLNRAITQQEIDKAIDEAAARHNVDPNLVRSVIKVESNFNPHAVSRKGAMGLMQLMPSTARSLNVSNPFDPAQNVDAGVRHLKNLLESYGGNVPLSLAAYNAGTGAVARSAGIPHFAETQSYVRRITNLYTGGVEGGHIFGNPVHDPVRVKRDERGVLMISNTD